MGMTIDDANKLLSVITSTITEDDDYFITEDGNLQVFKETLLTAIETMRKFQKIEQILDIEPVLTLPDNPTNGNMIQKIIPVEDIWRTYSLVHGKQVCVRFKHTEYVTCFEESYWDAPYKENTDD